MISVIIPVYNEEKTIKETLTSLSGRDDIEIIVADGGSTDSTKEIAHQFPVKIIETTKCRAIQMNEGARVAEGDMLLFLHSDCSAEGDAIELIENISKSTFIGGCLSQRIDSSRFLFRLIEKENNIRARMRKIFYGDQSIFVRRKTFFSIGGFPEVPIMEDVLFSKKLRAAGETIVLPDRIIASARRWEKHGIVKTAVLYCVMIILFKLGYPLEKIKLLYEDSR